MSFFPSWLLFTFFKKETYLRITFETTQHCWIFSKTGFKYPMNYMMRDSVYIEECHSTSYFTLGELTCAKASVRRVEENDWFFFFFFTSIMVHTEKKMAAQPSSFVWRTPWAEKPGGLYIVHEFTRVSHNWVTNTNIYKHTKCKYLKHKVAVFPYMFAWYFQVQKWYSVYSFMLPTWGRKKNF